MIIVLALCLLFAIAGCFFFVVRDHEVLMSASFLASLVLALMMGGA